jgi:hypothetical protein
MANELTLHWLLNKNNLKNFAMSFNESSPSVSVKKRNIQSLIEFCIENKIDFSVKSKAADDFDIEFLLNDTRKAIALGMCLKELKLEINGLQVTTVAAIKATKKVTAKEPVLVDTNNAEATMAFEDALQFDLGGSN